MHSQFACDRRPFFGVKTITITPFPTVFGTRRVPPATRRKQHDGYRHLERRCRFVIFWTQRKVNAFPAEVHGMRLGASLLDTKLSLFSPAGNQVLVVDDSRFSTKIPAFQRSRKKVERIALTLRRSGFPQIRIAIMACTWQFFLAPMDATAWHADGHAGSVSLFQHSRREARCNLVFSRYDKVVPRHIVFSSP